MKKKIKIELFDERFFINTEAPEEYIKELEKFVNDRIVQIQEKFLSRPNHQRTSGDLYSKSNNYKVSLLSALAIADEHLRYKNDVEEFRDRIIKKSRKIVDAITTVIGNRAE